MQYLILVVFVYCGIIDVSLASTPKIYAVVIGVANYKDNNIPNLKYSEKDAQSFHDFLRSPYAGDVPEENIMLLIGPNATRGNIIKGMVNLLKRSTTDDMVIFYFSGHGKADEGDNAGYLLSYDAESDNAPSTALSMAEVNDRIERCQAKLKVSYVDACHAGMFAAPDRKGSLEADNEIIASTFMQSVVKAGGGNIAFLASSARQQSQESDKLGHGVFTYYLLKGLQGEADKEQKDALGYNDGLVSVGEMVTYLNNKVPAATKYDQKPSVQGSYDEGFPLSVLTTNAVISNAIAKRPEVKKSSANAPLITPIVPVLDTATININSRVCNDESISGSRYGQICFINNYKEDIFLYYYFVGGNVISNMLVGKAEKSCTPDIQTGDHKDDAHDIKFYFRTVDDSKPIKYGTYTAHVEACKIKTQILTSKNLYLSTNGEKQEKTW